MSSYAGSNVVTSRSLQVALLLACWTFVWWMHRANDGLWFPDATRHAANGMFWKDFFVDLPPDPKAYALSYYARYPVINPLAYPPLFYWAESLAFSALGPNPHAAKFLVLLFTLSGGLVSLAWLRRWVGPETGWAAALLVLAPGVVLWSNAVMLNLPAMTLSLASLFCLRAMADGTRRGFTKRWLTPAAITGLAAVGTHYVAVVMAPVALLWAFPHFRAGKGSARRWAIAALLLAAIASPLILTLLKWAPDRVRYLYPNEHALRPETLWFYARQLWELCGPCLWGLAAFGSGIGLLDRDHRRHALTLLTWAVPVYLLLSVVRARDPRYILFVMPALVFLAAIGVRVAVRWCCRGAGIGRLGTQRATGGLLVVIVAAQAFLASLTHVPRVQGFRELAEYFRGVAPAEPVLYDGDGEGIFSFYVLANDPHRQRQVVRGDMLLYSFSMHRRLRLQQFVSSEEDVVERIRSKGGCRWIAVETERRSDVRAQLLLRKALAGREFEPVSRFDVQRNGRGCVEVYRYLPEIEHPAATELHFPGLGEESVIRVAPIPPRS